MPSELISEKEFTSRTLEAVIRVGLIALLLIWCFKIVLPFVVPTIWGVIIAVAIFPVYDWLQKLLGGRYKLTATLYTLLALALLITPAVMISGSFIETTQYLVHELKQGSLSVPPPGSNVRDWPLIGEKVYATWKQASMNLEGTLKEYSPQVRSVARMLFSTARGLAGDILQFIIAIIISGVLVVKSAESYRFTLRFFQRLSGEKNGLLFTNLARSTIRSVAQGVLGIAIIQSVLLAIGFYWMAIPGWGIWTVVIMVCAVAQLPLLLVLAPIIAYVFSVSEPAPAIVFTIWSIAVGLSDGFLKPLLLGRGMQTPTLVILVGAIGGMMLSGILGLFVGAIILALGYELFIAWLNKDNSDIEAAG